MVTDAHPPKVEPVRQRFVKAGGIGDGLFPLGERIRYGPGVPWCCRGRTGLDLSIHIRDFADT